MALGSVDGSPLQGLIRTRIGRTKAEPELILGELAQLTTLVCSCLADQLLIVPLVLMAQALQISCTFIAINSFRPFLCWGLRAPNGDELSDQDVDQRLDTLEPQLKRKDLAFERLRGVAFGA
jgi:hypothetical protein